jgi:anti-sigma-K factor RskA
VNIKDYISSGILEAYVLGELSEQERLDLEANLELFHELKKELDRVEQAQELFLLHAAIQPARHVRKKIFESIGQTTADEKVIPISRGRSSRILLYATAASVTLALVSSYLAYNYWNKWKNVSSELTTLIAQNQQIARNYNQVDQQLNKLHEDIRVMDNPRFKRIDMTGTANAPEALASVYWDVASRKVYLRIHNMKELARDNQYQLWAIIDGKPVDAGVFDVSTDGLLKMKDIGSGAVTFAVTIEPRGGKSSPTLETMQVAGNVTKG